MLVVFFAGMQGLNAEWPPIDRAVPCRTNYGVHREVAKKVLHDSIRGKCPLESVPTFELDCSRP